MIFLTIKSKEINLASEFDKIRRKWVNSLIVLYVTFVLFFISYYIMVYLGLYTRPRDYFISAVMSFTIYTIGWFAYKEPQIFNGEFFNKYFLPNNNSNKKVENDDELLEDLYSCVVNYINEKKPFKNNELRLSKFASELGHSTHLISKAINLKSGKNFNQFINEFRLYEVEQILKENTDNLNIKSIYFDVGFNNKATFYKAFKEKYNCTPKEYIKYNKLKK
ncbi:MAG: helix-turn-helix domain-containing protein [Flavobacteriaceae bacterium]